MSEYLLIAILSILAPLSAGLLVWGAAELRALIRVHVANAHVAGVLTRLTYAVEAAVAATSQTYTKALKEHAADGKLTTNEAVIALRTAEDRAKKLLGPDGVREVVKILGPSPDVLLTAIEDAVARARAKGVR